MARKRISFRFTNYERVTAPDYTALSKLVKDAKGARSVTEFAEICDLTLQSMSLILNAKIKSPLSDQLIKAIADNAAPGSGVTLDHLLEANGMAKKSVDNASEDTLLYRDIQSAIAERRHFGILFEKTAHELITTQLLSKGYTLTQNINPAVFDGASLCLKSDFELKTNALESDGITTWCFNTYLTNGHVNTTDLSRKFTTITSAAYFTQFFTNGIKFSLVIDSNDVLDEIKKIFKDKKIPDIISVVLIDSIGREIIEEYFIPNYQEKYTKVLV